MTLKQLAYICFDYLNNFKNFQFHYKFFLQMTKSSNSANFVEFILYLSIDSNVSLLDIAVFIDQNIFIERNFPFVYVFFDFKIVR